MMTTGIMFPGRVDPKAMHKIKQIALIIYTDVYKLRNLKKIMKLNFDSKVPSGIFLGSVSVNGIK